MDEKLVKLGNITSILSGILLIIAHALNYGAGANGTILGSLGVFVAHLLLVFTFLGLYIRQSELTGLLAFFAMLFGIIGTIIVTTIVYVELAGASGEKVDYIFHTPVTEPLYTFGPLLFVIGMILLAVSMIRSKVFHSWSGYLLLIGTIVFSVASIIGESQGAIEVIGSIFTGMGFILAGIPKNYPPAEF